MLPPASAALIFDVDKFGGINDVDIAVEFVVVVVVGVLVVVVEVVDVDVLVELDVGMMLEGRTGLR